ncbi:MAG: hypothetical protein ACRDTF_13500, partial [Pseudonocardiaceae bacterium]
LLTREFWTTADQLLNADGALLASYEQVRAAKEEHEARSREAALAKAYAEAQAHASTAPHRIVGFHVAYHSNRRSNRWDSSATPSERL